MIGLFGTGLGIIGGIVLSNHIGEVAAWIERTFHMQLLTSNVYYVDALPSKLEWGDIKRVSIAAVCMSVFVTLYPSFSASRTQPAEALRYE